MGKKISLLLCLLFFITFTGYYHFNLVHSFDLYMLALTGGILMVLSGIVVDLSSREHEKDLHVCRVCWLVSTPRKTAKGSLLMEYLLWCFFIIPGMLYSLWRHSPKGITCPACSSVDIIPIGSKKGQRFFDEIYSDKNTRYIGKVLDYQQEDFSRKDYQRYEEQFQAREQGL